MPERRAFAGGGLITGGDTQWMTAGPTRVTMVIAGG
jgi:hypothetical protein